MFAISFIVILVLSYLVIGVTPQKIARSESKANSVANFVVQGIKNGVQLISSNSSRVFSPDLSMGNGVYVLSKSAAPCKDYLNTTRSRRFGFRCKTLNALYRGFWAKEIDVEGYNKLRIEAHLEVNNYTDNYFAECGYKGVNSNDSVDLIALSSDPDRELASECNHEVGEDRWHHCSITNKDVSAITHCGIPKCTSSRNCDMEIDVSGEDAIYMLFSVSDDWFADVEGILSDVKITLTK